MKDIGSDIIKELYKERNEDARKYDHGMVLVIGGSDIYTGSPILSAMAAMRAGADIAQIIAPQRAADAGAVYGPDLITFPLSGSHLSGKHLGKLLALTRGAKDVSRGKLAVVLGGGVGRAEESKRVIREYVKKTDIPIVVDADGIYAFEGEKVEVNNERIIFTPHLYEFFILTGKNANLLSREERAYAVKESAKDLGCTILLKGMVDIVSDGESVELNKMSVPQMTIGGTGDVLAGVTGALLAKGHSLLEAGKGAAVVNTMAGELAAKEKGESIIATDVIDKIHQVINQ